MSTTKHTRPNILLIMADQLAGPALDEGSPVKAPHIKALAERGVVFEQAYCNFPICAPSRSSMLSGLLPHSFAQFDNSSEFPASIPTIPHYLRQLGYRALLSGKMHFIGPDQLHGYEDRLTTEIYPANFAWTVDWTQGAKFRPTNLTMAPVLEAGSCIRSLQIDYDEEVAHHSIQGLYDLARADDDQPFFLTVSFTHPHSPYVTSQSYWDRYQDDEIDLPKVADIPLAQKDHLSHNLHYCQGRDEFPISDEQVRTARHAYYGMISYIDDKVGELLAALEHSGQADNTIVIFTADHGDMMGERGMWYKQHFFEWASRIPFIVSWPGHYTPARLQQNVSLVDLLPTLVDIATDGQGYDGLADYHGHSLYGLLTQTDMQWEHPVFSDFSADGSTGPSRMVRDQDLKYMYLEGVEELLYDLKQDPLELNNLAHDPAYTPALTRLRQLALQNWNPQQLRRQIMQDQQNRRMIHRVTGGEPDYVFALADVDYQRYVRNAGAADTKARARYPYVEPAIKQASKNGEGHV